MFDLWAILYPLATRGPTQGYPNTTGRRIEPMDIVDVISWAICIAFFAGAIALAAAWTHLLIQLPTWYEETLRKEKEKGPGNETE